MGDTDELTEKQRKNLDMHHTLALIHGFNEMAIKATTLGEKVYYRMARDAAEARFTTLGGKIDRIEEHAPLLVIPGHVPEVRFDVRDVELMRACVAEHDAARASSPIPPIGATVLLRATVVAHNTFPGSEGPRLPVPCVKVRDGISFGVACEDLQVLAASPGASEESKP